MDLQEIPCQHALHQNWWVCLSSFPKNDSLLIAEISSKTWYFWHIFESRSVFLLKKKPGPGAFSSQLFILRDSDGPGDVAQWVFSVRAWRPWKRLGGKQTNRSHLIMDTPWYTTPQHHQKERVGEVITAHFLKVFFVAYVYKKILGMSWHDDFLGPLACIVDSLPKMGSTFRCRWKNFKRTPCPSGGKSPLRFQWELHHVVSTDAGIMLKYQWYQNCPSFEGYTATQQVRMAAFVWKAL